MKKLVGLCKNICRINMSNDYIKRVIRFGKVIEDNERPLKEEEG